MDAELQAGFSQLRELFPAPIPLELKDLVQIFGAQLAPRLRAAWAIECRLQQASQPVSSARSPLVSVPRPHQVITVLLAVCLKHAKPSTPLEGAPELSVAMLQKA